MEQKRVTILGSTGSIGTQALQVVRRLGYRLEAISANTSTDLAEQQVRAFSPRYAVMMDPQAAADLKIRLADTSTQVLCGMEGLCQIASLPENDLVLNSVVGMIGLQPTLAAIEAGTDLALANKETLVAGGQLVVEAAQKKKVKILPVDSEHSAIFQCLQGNPKKDALHKIILTASGGPFFGKKREELERVTVKQALRHPNWVMGAKLTIDSSTLMNKGLEVIEAVWLFQKPVDDIEVVSPGERNPFDGRIYRRFLHRPAGRTGYADSDSVCHDLSEPGAQRGKAAFLDRLWETDLLPA